MSAFFTTEHAAFAGLEFLTVKSNALGRRADLTVYAPPGPLPDNLPVVILLHGVYGSHWAWALKGRVHETAQRLIDSGQIRPMLLVMPSDGLYGDGSGYVPHRTADYEAWIVKDVVQLMREHFPAVTATSPLFIAGLSMGGYGALRLGARFPERFRGFAGLSSITEFGQLRAFVADYDALAGEALEQGSVLDWLVRHRDRLPPFRFDCGLSDDLLEANRALHGQLEALGIAHTYEELPGGHEWPYWERNIERTLVFFQSLV